MCSAGAGASGVGAETSACTGGVSDAATCRGGVSDAGASSAAAGAWGAGDGGSGGSGGDGGGTAGEADGAEGATGAVEFVADPPRTAHIANPRVPSSNTPARAITFGRRQLSSMLCKRSSSNSSRSERPVTSDVLVSGATTSVAPVEATGCLTSDVVVSGSTTAGSSKISVSKSDVSVIGGGVTVFAKAGWSTVATGADGGVTMAAAGSSAIGAAAQARTGGFSATADGLRFVADRVGTGWSVLEIVGGLAATCAGGTAEGFGGTRGGTDLTANGAILCFGAMDTCAAVSPGCPGFWRAPDVASDRSIPDSLIPGKRCASLRKAQSVTQSSSALHNSSVLANLRDGVLFRQRRIRASMRLSIPAVGARRLGMVTRPETCCRRTSASDSPSNGTVPVTIS